MVSGGRVIGLLSVVIRIFPVSGIGLYSPDTSGFELIGHYVVCDSVDDVV